MYEPSFRIKILIAAARMVDDGSPDRTVRLIDVINKKIEEEEKLFNEEYKHDLVDISVA